MFLALAPSVALMVTSFIEIVVSLSLLRNALGLQQTPPNLVINGLALILTPYVIYSVGLKMQAVMQQSPPAEASSDFGKLIAYASAAKEPLREFPIKHSWRRRPSA